MSKLSRADPTLAVKRKLEERPFQIVDPIADFRSSNCVDCSPQGYWINPPHTFHYSNMQEKYIYIMTLRMFHCLFSVKNRHPRQGHNLNPIWRDKPAENVRIKIRRS